MKDLTGKQRRWLRGLGHHLPVHVQVADVPLSEGVLAEMANRLERHELIKVKFAVDDREARGEAIAGAANDLKASLIQQIGKTALYFKSNPKLKEPLKLPKD